MTSEQQQKVIADKIYKSILATSKHWISELDYYGKNQFKEKVKGEGWTIGQIYDHIVHGTYDFHLKHISNCLQKTNGSVLGKKKLIGRILYFLGRYPALKIKGKPESIYTPAQPESPEKFRDEFYKFLKVLNKNAIDIGIADLKYKTQHPRLGWLNALEWLKLIEMHTRHHLRQKQRLDKTLRSEFKYTPGEEVYSEM